MTNYEIVKKTMKEHMSGKLNHEYKLWSLIQFNDWYEKHNIV